MAEAKKPRPRKLAYSIGPEEQVMFDLVEAYMKERLPGVSFRPTDVLNQALRLAQKELARHAE